MTSSKIIAMACAALTLAGCATAGDSDVGGTASAAPSSSSRADWQPSVDMTHVDHAKYASDLAACRTEASNDSGKGLRGDVIKGGVAGAVAIGALAVATGGLALLPLAAGAAVTTGAAGAAAGGAVGMVTADGKYKTSVNKCLRDKGYKVTS